MAEEIQVEEVALQAVSSPENRSLLKAYKWQTSPERGEALGSSPGASPTPSSKWRKLQSWKRSRSHPEADAKGEAEANVPTADGNAVSETAPATAEAKRSVFQRAFSAPAAKYEKEPCQSQEAAAGSNRLRNYFRSVSKRLTRKNVGKMGPEQEGVAEALSPAIISMPLTPSPEVHVWDISNFTLLDGQLMMTNWDEENAFRTRSRTGSCLSGSSLQQACSPEAGDTSSTAKTLNGPRSPGKLVDQETISANQSKNVKALIWKRKKKYKPHPKLNLSASSITEGERSQNAHGSRDSLSIPLNAVELLDLSAEKEVVIRPLHSSLLGEKFCFEIITPEGSRCFGCTSVEERDRWIENLRRTVQPNKDNCERVENTLSLWIYEVKDFLPKKKYFCELHLNRALYARTTSKLNQGTMFWGEHFEFYNLPPVSEVTIHILREDEKKKKEPKELTPVSSVTIPLSDLVSRQHVEKWYPLCNVALSKEKPAVPSIRVKGRYQNIRVLPIMQYKEFAEYIAFNYMELCTELEPAISVKDKEELACCLVHVLQSTGKAKSFLIDLGIAEVDRFDEKESLIFRENTLATKAIDEYMKLVGQKYLMDTLGEFIVQLYATEDSCEVDPSKCLSNDLSDNQNNLRQSCEEVLKKITDSFNSFPAELNEIFALWQEECRYREKLEIGQRLVCASLFLRFLCPAIMSPSLFHLTQEYPDCNTSRTLTLVAKVIQNLANFTTFGDKEAYMGFMNEFLEHNWESMKTFLQNVSSLESETQMSTYDGYIDLASELSVLHSLLCGISVTVDQPTKERLEPLPTILRAIEEGTPVPSGILNNPSAIASTEKEKPGFLAPRDLPKHSPLVTKSLSMMSIQRNKGREEDRVFHGLLPSHSFAQSRRHVQRTQSVPASNRAHRVQKHRSTEHLPQTLQEEGPQKKPRLRVAPRGGGMVPQGRPRIHQSASLPRRKSTVPWLRSSEEACQDNRELDFSWPSEKTEKQIKQLKDELHVTKEKQKSLEVCVEALMEQIQTLHHHQAELLDCEQRKRERLKETHVGHKHNRRASAEEERKRVHPGVAVPCDTEQRIMGLEDRLSNLEREHTLILARVNQLDENPTVLLSNRTLALTENINGSSSPLIK
ncbi:RAS protein activator like-3 [Ambystoma mexicanum]|uniref:RAS protein activator like-3 n=1 Tax=Ambystoma mexicanum TaxID=8296 RepID=UPI0037E70F42